MKDREYLSASYQAYDKLGAAAGVTELLDTGYKWLHSDRVSHDRNSNPKSVSLICINIIASTVSITQFIRTIPGNVLHSINIRISNSISTFY